MNWKHYVGENIVDEHRNLIITNQFIKYGTYKKNENTYQSKMMYYNYDCKMCGYTNGEISQSNLEKGIKCSCCSNRIIIKGINDLGTVRSDLKKYFIENKEYLYSESSGKYDYFKCPECNASKKMMVANLSRHGFMCNCCSDGVSYPEKFLCSLLKQLNIEFIPQLSKKDFKWCDKYRYDFYLIKHNIIIEIHGEQHYSKCFTTHHSLTLEEQKERDILKYNLAINNGISKYIIIDASKSELEYIKTSILQNNDMMELINSKNKDVDWENCNIDANSNLLKNVCLYWNDHNSLTSYELADIFQLSQGVILKYLHIGTSIGWCNFSKEEQSKKAGEKRKGKPHIQKEFTLEQKQVISNKLKEANKQRAKKICKYSLENELLEIIESLNYLKKEYGYSMYSISECCKGNRETAYGYKWNYYHDNPKTFINVYIKIPNKISKANKSGVSGVAKDRYGKWYAHIQVNGKTHYLGYFKDFDDAAKARKEAEDKYFGKFSHDNSRLS